MTEFDLFLKGLDEQQPNWFIDFATANELRDFVQDKIHRNEHMDKLRSRLRVSVATRLMMPVRAALGAGVISLKEATVKHV